MAQDPLTREEEAEDALAPPAGGPETEAPASPGALLAPERTATKPAAVEVPLRLPSSARAEPSEHALFLARKHFGALDGLRAVGILAVVWHHTMGGPGRFGANLFFLLSGFLVTTLLVRESAKKGTVDVTRFRTRRARRLYPLYFTVLAGYVALVGFLEPAGATRAAFFDNLPHFATFTSNWFVGLDEERVIFYFAWSLAAQEQFYLVWPLFLKHLDRRASAAALVSLIATAYLTRAGLFDLALPSGSALRTLVLSLMPALLLGALLALTLNARRGFEALQKPFGSRWISSLLLATALVLWRTPSAPEPLMHVVLLALTTACVLREDHWLARVLHHPVAVHVGTVSYGIYLMHMLCHNVVERVLTRLGGDGLLDFALTALFAVGVATLSHRYFENRFLPPEKRVRPA